MERKYDRPPSISARPRAPARAGPAPASGQQTRVRGFTGPPSAGRCDRRSGSAADPPVPVSRVSARSGRWQTAPAPAACCRARTMVRRPHVFVLPHGVCCMRVAPLTGAAVRAGAARPRHEMHPGQAGLCREMCASEPEDRVLVKIRVRVGNCMRVATPRPCSGVQLAAGDLRAYARHGARRGGGRPHGARRRAARRGHRRGAPPGRRAPTGTPCRR